ncbi:hypothetical protein EV146_101253 [Mesobacillus foraminis]|uniref:Spore coat protein Z n=1 Tax=Mesobacillus foraminis TaxID=279826 RepID=A0A4R2BMP8_9BACI|nr:hypothetical protein EV146_101253 [Mesobacillus foraminis]
MSKKCSCGKKHHDHKHHDHKHHDHKKPHHDDKSGWLRDLILDSCDRKHRGLLEGLLFGRHHDCHDHCHDHKPKPPVPPTPVNCEGCACSILEDAIPGEMFKILPEGDNQFLAFNPDDQFRGTDFEFVEFFPETCCAEFIWFQTGGGPPPTRDQRLVIDCRCICGLSQDIDDTPTNG